MCNDKQIIALLSGKKIPRWYAGYRFEKEGSRQFRDCMVFYRDGKVKFERYCYGEAAGLVFDVWIDTITSDGTIVYRQPFDLAVKPEALPQRFSSMPNEDTLFFDENSTVWKLTAVLKTDCKNGYTKAKVYSLSLLSR